MKIAIRYYTQTGNTKKLAEAIAEVVDAEVKDVACSLEENTEILFLCNSVYWAGVDKHVKKFLKENASKIGCLVNISTAALVPSSYRQMKKIAAQSSIKLAEEEFHCRGQFKTLHSGHPDELDLSEVKEFARKMVHTYEA